MALRQTKKISELPALTPATLDTTFVVGISGSTTYKISINQLTSSLDSTFATDLVTNALSGTLDGKLSTSSFNSYTASISTASLVTSINNLNTFTASQSTSSLVDRLNAIENVSGSWITESETGSFLTSLSGAISSSAQITALGFISTSVDLTPLNSFTQSIDGRVDSLENSTGSYLTSLNGAISSSSQLTSSYDTRYVLSGSITQTTWDNIASKPSDIVSGSSQLTSSFDTRYAASGSAPTLFLLEAYANETYTLPGGFTDDTCRYSIVNNTVNVPSNWFNTSTYTFTPLKAGYWEITAEYDVYRGSGVEASIAIKKNGGVVAAVGSFGAVSQLVTKIVYLNGSTDYINIINVGNVSNSRGQFDGRSWFQAKWIGQ